MNDKCSFNKCSNQVKRKGKKFCSSKCYNESKNVWELMTCGFCQKQFEGVPGKSKYCTKACSNSATKRNRLTLTCKRCSKQFEVVAGRANAKYCSYECFGYDRRDGEEQEVILVCECCGSEFKKQFIHRYTRFCSHKCSSSGENNGMFKHPERSAWNGNSWNEGLTKETDSRLAAVGKKISKVISDKIVAGEWNHQHGFKSGYFTSTKSGRKMFYRSSYELAALEKLDKDANVKDFKTEPFSIVYTGLDGFEHRYHPDIIVELNDGTQKLIEIKPLSLKDKQENVLKEKVGRDFCEKNSLSFEIWTESIINA